MKTGAWDDLSKPLPQGKLFALVETLRSDKTAPAKDSGWLADECRGLVADSPSMHRARTILNLGRYIRTALTTGETDRMRQHTDL